MTTFNGYVRLFRELLCWQWYQNPNVLRLYIHLLLKASFRDFDFEGRSYKAGELITNRKKLAEELGLSESQILTALDKLKSTGEIDIKSTNKFSVITLKNWAKMQGEQYFFASTSTTKEHQTDNKSTHLNNKNNVNNANKYNAHSRKGYDIYSGSIDWSKMDLIINGGE